MQDLIFSFLNSWLGVIIFGPLALFIIYYDIKYPDRNTIIVHILSFIAGCFMSLVIKYMQTFR